MMKKNHLRILGVTLLLMAVSPVHGEETRRCVRFAYLVSSDREVVPEYVQAIEDAARDIRGWYAKQLGGPTFTLADPIVEVLHSDKLAAWFTTHPNGKDEASWGFYNTLDEMKRLRKVRPIRDDSIWVVYSDGPGNKGRAIPGFAYLPEDDLLGLVGKHPTQKDPVRWVAGMGHELGHTLGLPHPRDTKKHYDALMWAGFYGKYPDHCYLTDEDKAVLARNPFIVASAELSLVPKPHHVTALAGQPWRLGAAVRVLVPKRIPGAKEHFQVVANAVKMLAGSDVQFVDNVDEADLVLVAEPNLAPEAYLLQVRADGVRIEASTLKGLTHATATLLQLFGQYEDVAIPALEIRDEPDCSYRYFMVDLGRNPHSLESLKETIDLLWFYKLDSLQLTLPIRQSLNRSKLPSILALLQRSIASQSSRTSMVELTSHTAYSSRGTERTSLRWPIASTSRRIRPLQWFTTSSAVKCGISKWRATAANKTFLIPSLAWWKSRRS